MSGADDLTPTALAATISVAESEGLTVVSADDSTLLLDLDTAAAREQYERVLPSVQQYFDVTSIESWQSRGGNLHVKLTLGTPRPAYLRYALQAALGSDGVKETLTLMRELSGCGAQSSILFRPPRKKLVNRKLK